MRSRRGYSYNHLHLLLSCSILLIFLRTATAQAAAASDILTKGSNLTDGKTLVSSGGLFTLGFFAPGAPTRRYLGILFTATNSSDAVWVANRDRPLSDTSGVLVVTGTGNLVLLDGSGRTAWSSNTTGATSPTVQLLDTGNLVLRDGTTASDAARLWQSFDHPTNTLLPGMKVGRNLWGGGEWSLTSWRAPDDPSPGAYRYTMVLKALPETVVLDSSSGAVRYRSGVWNGLTFSGVPEMASYAGKFAFQVTVSPGEVSYGFTTRAGAPFSRLVLKADTDTPLLQRLGWDPKNRVWTAYYKGPRDNLCDAYGKCGPSGLCNEAAAATSFCSCIPGFSPASPADWDLRYTSGGCRRDVPLGCGSNETDWFAVLPGVKLPDTENATVDVGITVEECRARCLANCSCVAYAAADIRGGGGGSGCLMWPENLVDLRYVDGGQTLYLRQAWSASGKVKKKRHAMVIYIAAGSILGSIVILSLVLFVQLSRRRRRSLITQITEAVQAVENPSQAISIALATVKSQTRNFSTRNVIGEGTFGIVYEGKLPRGHPLLQGLAGRSIAVKRLKPISDLPEIIVSYFTREMQVMSGLGHHKNVLRLLAYCDEGNERILVYEYMHRRSLDSYIFGKRRDLALLNWQRRLRIVQGIAEGVKHLHEGEGSPGNVIHQDLKPGNVLLDGGWTAKVADFGTAKLLVAETTGTRTRIGTPGYMAPEYVQSEGGETTLKCDVYSFGVTLLETLSGRRNCERPTLISEAWRLWIERSITDLLDSAVVPAPARSELPLLRRCIKVALLCVQENPEERPSMAAVAEMLCNSSSLLVEPTVPTVGSRILATLLEADLSRTTVFETIDLT